MEWTLHRQLKSRYAPPGAEFEARLGRFRIDVRRGRNLVEIQTSSLAALRDKTRELLADYRVTIVKPIIARRLLIMTDPATGAERYRRWSPKRGGWADAFDELAMFTQVFPHRRLTLELPLLVVEETRVPRRARRYWHRNYRIVDQRLIDWQDCRTLRKPADLLSLLNLRLPKRFSTRDLADQCRVAAAVAQRIAYCLRQARVATPVGKEGNRILYQLTRAAALDAA